MSMANETYLFIKDIKPGLKNVNVVFIVLEIGKWAPLEPSHPLFSSLNSLLPAPVPIFPSPSFQPRSALSGCVFEFGTRGHFSGKRLEVPLVVCSTLQKKKSPIFKKIHIFRDLVSIFLF